MKKILSVFMALAASVAIASPSLNPCSTSDTTVNALACFNALGNDANGTNGSSTIATQGLLGTNFNGLVGNLGSQLFTSQPWFLLDKTNSLDGTQFSKFINNPTTKSGVLNFDGPLFGYYALTLKVGDRYNAYLMNFGNETSVRYNINKDLSHASLWTFNGINSGGSCEFGNFCDPVTQIPEPSSFALMAAGLLGVVLFRRRKSSVI